MSKSQKKTEEVLESKCFEPEESDELLELLKDKSLVNIKELVDKLFDEMIKNNTMIANGVFVKIKKDKLTCFLLTLLQSLSQ